MSGLTLSKGANLSLAKAAPGLTKLSVGLGWSPRTTDGAAFDLDASALLVSKQADGSYKVRSNGDFVFYGQPASQDGSVSHSGDNLTGEGSGDDEVISVDLTAVPDDVDKVVFAVTIYDANTRHQNFGQVADSYARLLDQNNQEVPGTKFELGEDASQESCIVFTELYRHNGEWKWRAVGAGYASGLSGLVNDYGVRLG